MRAVLLVVLFTSIAAADRSPPSVFATATATSAQDKFPAWKAIENADSARMWCPNKGNGVGESMTVVFDRAIAITELDVYPGSVASFELTAGKQKLVVDKRFMDVKLDGSMVDSLTFKILAIAPNKKVGCLQGFRAAAPTTHFYRFVYGVDAAALKALPAFATSIDAAFKKCDATALGTAVKFPLPHEQAFQEEPGSMEGPPPSKKVTYKSAADLAKACQATSSVLATGYAGGSFDADLPADLLHARTDDAGIVQISNQHTTWTVVSDGKAWKLTSLLTTKVDIADAPHTVMEGQMRGFDDPKRLATTYTSDATMAVLVGKAALVKPADLGTLPGLADSFARVDDNRVTTLARDGQSGWMTFDLAIDKVAYRVSQVLVRTPNGWRIAGGIVSAPQPNKPVNDGAKSGKPFVAMPALPTVEGDASLRDAFKAQLAGPFDKDAAARKELIGVGSGPGERTTTGPQLAKPWAVAWAKKLALGGFVVQLAPSGTTGWVTADVTLDKGKYKIPFRVLFVFDKTYAGTWSLVHAHFAVPAPT